MANTQDGLHEREDHRVIVAPLTRELDRRRRSRQQTYEQAGEQAGVSMHLTFRYLKNQQLTPSYVTLTRLIVGAGLTPDQAAEMVGLYSPQEGSEHLDARMDPRLVEVARFVSAKQTPREVRENLLRSIEGLLQVAKMADPPPFKRRGKRAVAQ